MTSTLSDVATFYGGFRDRLLTDYREGSPRVDAALGFARQALAGSRSILDVGCGIGWTSMEMQKTGAKVTGVDISPVLIATANQLFGDRCVFINADFVDLDIGGGFDAVLMVDSYEHFPRESRAQVHAQIVRTDCDRIALTVPTVETQRYARANGIPLQIIDEDVTTADVERLAKDIGGVIEIHEVVSVYRVEDYRHVLIRR